MRERERQRDREKRGRITKNNFLCSVYCIFERERGKGGMGWKSVGHTNNEVEGISLPNRM